MKMIYTEAYGQDSWQKWVTYYSKKEHGKKAKDQVDQVGHGHYVAWKKKAKEYSAPQYFTDQWWLQGADIDKIVSRFK